MKKILAIVLLVLLILGIYYIKPIYTYIDINFIEKSDFNRNIIESEDRYIFNIKQNFVNTTTKKIINDKQDLLNIIYTSLNYGWNEVSFYCSENYNNCFQELNFLATEDIYIPFINDLVHPFHKYKKMTINRNNMGKITISYENMYTKDMKKYINNKINEIVKELKIDDNTPNVEKIKRIHDYLINYANYSTENEEDKTAYGFLKNHQGNCRGYTETMLILLHEVGIKSIPISNGHHVWNLIYDNDGWYHTDVTWDDPKTYNGEDVLIYDYYMITSKKLEEIDIDNDHIYDLEFYNKDFLLEIK